MASDSHDDSRIGRVLDDRYRLDEKIGSGGMGVIYRGERIGIGKRVAIKLLHRSSALDPEHRKRFEREAEAMSRVTHPNLVSVIDHGISEESPYLVMEYHPGETLGDVIDRGALPPRRAVTIARQIASGIQSVHAAGVIHRDLKPDNVILLADLDHDFAKVLDFGIAKILDLSADRDMTAAGLAIGTPAYMSPEAAYGNPLDGRADVYAIGILLFEMVTGKQPFSAEENLAVLRMQVEDPPPHPRDLGAKISEELESVILKTLEKAPEDRYQSASDLVKALDGTPEAREEKVVETRTVIREVEVERVSEPPRRRGGFKRGVIILVVGIAIGWFVHDPVTTKVRGFFGHTPPDAAIDAKVDAPIDAKIDAPIDARPDAAIDAPPPPDASIDAPADATEPADALVD